MTPPEEINENLIFLLLLKLESEDKKEKDRIQKLMFDRYTDAQIGRHMDYLIHEGYANGSVKYKSSSKWFKTITRERKLESINRFGIAKLEELRKKRYINHPQEINIVKFRTLLNSLFTIEELKDLAFSLDKDTEDFNSSDKNTLTRDMVIHFQNRRELNELFGEALKSRNKAESEFLACLE